MAIRAVGDMVGPNPNGSLKIVMSLPNIAIHQHHNAAAAVSLDDDIVAVLEWERLLGVKNASFDAFEPTHTKDFILHEIYNYLEEKFGFTQYENFIMGHDREEIPDIYKSAIPANNYIIDPDHHPSHALGSLYQSPFERALIISIDGGSNDGFFVIHIGDKATGLEKIGELGVDLGSHYNTVGAFCDEIKNYHPLTAAGKVLGLQSYGVVVEEWKGPIREFFQHLPFWQNLEERVKLLSYRVGVPFTAPRLHGCNPEQVIKMSGENSYNFCRTTQEVFEDIVFEETNELILQHNLPIILTGGCALNIVLNTKMKDKYSQEVFVAPNSSDCGIPVGLLCKYMRPTKITDVTYKGIDVLDKYCLMEEVEKRTAYRADLNIITEDLVQNRILGVVQGNSEHGPRALGNRSILCSPIPEDMKDTLNLKVKHREWFRPFAPIVRLEDVSEYFEWEGESRWMNFCPKVKEEYKKRLPAITHIDGTARVQTITQEQNPFIYELLTAFKERTGIGVLVNTSFNVDGKPILSTYKDALKVFDETELDRLYLDGYYFIK